MFCTCSALPPLPESASNRTRAPAQFPYAQSAPKPRLLRPQQSRQTTANDVKVPKVDPRSTRPSPPTPAEVYLQVISQQPPPQQQQPQQQQRQQQQQQQQGALARQHKRLFPVETGCTDVSSGSSSSQAGQRQLPPTAILTRKVCGQLSRCFKWRWLYDRVLPKWLHVLSPTSSVVLFRRLVALAPATPPLDPAHVRAWVARPLEGNIGCGGAMQGQVSGQVGVMLLSQQRCIDLGLHFTAQQQQQQQQKGTSAAMDSVRPAAQQQQQQQQQQHQTQQGQVPAVAGTVDESTVEASRSAGSRSMSWQVLHTTPAPCCIISSHPCVAAAWRVLLMTAADAGALQHHRGATSTDSTHASNSPSSSSPSSTPPTWPQLSGGPLPASGLLERAQFEVMVAAASTSVQGQLPNMSSKQLVEVLWCLGRLRVATSTFLEVWCMQPLAQPAMLAPQQLCRCLRSLSDLGVAPTPAWQQQLLTEVIAWGAARPGAAAEAAAGPLAAAAASQRTVSSPQQDAAMAAAAAIPPCVADCVAVAVAAAAGCLAHLVEAQEGVWWDGYLAALQGCVAAAASPPLYLPAASRGPDPAPGTVSGAAGGQQLLPLEDVSCLARIAAATAHLGTPGAQKVNRWVLGELQQQLCGTSTPRCTPAAAVDVLLACSRWLTVGRGVGPGPDGDSTASLQAPATAPAEQAAAGKGEAPSWAASGEECGSGAWELEMLVDMALGVLQQASFKLPTPALLQLCSLVQGQPPADGPLVTALAEGLQQGSQQWLLKSPLPVVVGVAQALAAAGQQASLEWASACALRTQGELRAMHPRQLLQLVVSMQQLGCFLPGSWCQALLVALAGAAVEVRELQEQHPQVVALLDRSRLTLEVSQMTQGDNRSVSLLAGSPTTPSVWLDMAGALQDRLLLLLGTVPLLPTLGSTNSSFGALARGCLPDEERQAILDAVDLGLGVVGRTEGEHPHVWRHLQQQVCAVRLLL